MKMLATIAWRNVWRSRGRSLVVIGSIVVGIWALIFMLGFMNGFMISYINGAIKHEISHIQIHEANFKKDPNIGFVIPGGMDLAESLASDPRIQAVSPRSLTSGMISSPRKVERWQDLWHYSRQGTFSDPSRLPDHGGVLFYIRPEKPDCNRQGTGQYTESKTEFKGRTYLPGPGKQPCCRCLPCSWYA